MAAPSPSSQQFNLTNRLRLVKVLILLAFVAGVLCSFLLWRNEGRLLPVIKPFDAFPTLPAPLDLILLTLFVASLSVWIFLPKKLFGGITIASLLIILIQDQMRWQPWVYIYLLLLLPFLQQSRTQENDKSILNTLQLMLAGIYVWSGLHKFTVNFIEGPFAQMMVESGFDLDFLAIRKLGYFIPLIEMSMGFALLFPKFRKTGIVAVIGMHLFILFYLSQWATIQNSVVYPWNIAMILLVILLFGGLKEKTVIPLKQLRTKPVMALPLLLVWLFPLFNVRGFWDHYPSFSFYSNKTSQYYIAVKNTSTAQTDKPMQQYFVTMNGLNDGKVIEMNHWALSELNVPFYPELRVFKKASQKFYDHYKGADSVLFLELSFVEGKPHFETYTYQQLQSR
jgi:uncharacterized membrane protein YphA (DoxX/SURF4 family)